MPVNADKPHLWEKDTAASVDFYNNWFIKFAPKTFRDTRTKTAEKIIETFKLTGYLKDISTGENEQSIAILSYDEKAGIRVNSVDKLKDRLER